MTARTSRLRRPLPALIAALLVGCAGEPTGPPTTTIERFASFWATLEAQYSYFAYKNVDWDSLRTEFRPRAEAATNG